jgi:hypothetical protein
VSKSGGETVSSALLVLISQSVPDQTQLLISVLEGALIGSRKASLTLMNHVHNFCINFPCIFSRLHVFVSSLLR